MGKRALTSLSPSASDIFPLLAPCPSLAQAAYCLGSRDSTESSAAIQGMWLPVTHLARQVKMSCLPTCRVTLGWPGCSSNRL